MSSHKSSKARGATGGRHAPGDGERPSGPAGLSSGGTGAHDVPSAPRGLGPPGCAGDRGADDPRSGEESVGLLEMCGSVTEPRPTVESQTALTGVLSAPADPPAPDEEVAPAPSAPAARGAPAGECRVGGGFYERHPLWRSAVPDLECP